MLRDIISGGEEISGIHSNLKIIEVIITLEEQGRLGGTGTKILRWVDKFKAIADITAQYDPVHAALPWAGFRLLLQVPPIVTI